MSQGEEEEGGCYPDPADFDKVDVEDVALFGEVAGRIAGVVGLRVGEIGRVAAGGVEGAEEGTEEECAWVESQEGCFECGG